ncbi:MAG TPA: ubiquinone/menaquinone biosynthesis methyltransferase [Candidatus Acidoferrales bacterium]|nr:ubiquinone/menaquinone biosynthesis methyltransferase [Candidatus Acidoferrales bacterium]
MSSSNSTTSQIPAEKPDRGSLPGTRPEGTRDEREASTRVREMFSRIAPSYDFLNHLLTLSLDRLWRGSTAKRFAEILARPDARALDLCCGTGDLTFALERRARQAAASGTAGASIFGADFALPMLDRARGKASRSHSRAAFLSADALSLPFASDSFDLVTAAWGFRNLANYSAGLVEIYRVLRRGGQIGILDCCEPQPGITSAAFRFYFRRVLPMIGGTISGSREAYQYLPASVSKFLRPDELSASMKSAGFKDVRYELWNLGTIALHIGTK